MTQWVLNLVGNTLQLIDPDGSVTVAYELSGTSDPILLILNHLQDGDQLAYNVAATDHFSGDSHVC